MTTAARGFTLLEVMVVLVLIGIITGFALLSAGRGPQERLAEEAQRLAALVQLQQQEAILASELRGIKFSQAGYALLRRDAKNNWQPPTAADSLIQHRLPDDMALGLWIEGQPISLKNPSRWPQVVLLASGEATEFVAVFGLTDEQQNPTALRYRVAGDAMGRLTVGAVKR